MKVWIKEIKNLFLRRKSPVWTAGDGSVAQLDRATAF